MATLPWDSWWTRGLLLLCGLGFLAVTAEKLRDDWRFAHEGRTARGIVVGKEVRTTTSHRRGSGSRSRTEHHDVTYRFVVDGKTIEGEDELTAEDWKRLAEGEPVDVLYLPDTPSSNRLAGARPWGSKVILGIIGLVFTTLGVLTSV